MCAAYIGATPVPQATQHRQAFTATASQTSFATVGYTPQFVDVYLNGVKLAAADYTATNGSDIVLTTGAALNDILEIVAYTPFEVADQTFTGTTTVTDSGAAPLVANRTTSDGDITVFQKDGTTVGSIVSTNGNSIVIDGANGRVYFSSHPTATIDNNYDLGAITIRWDDIYATNAIIQTSDRNEKEAIASLTPTEMLVAARLSSSFKNFKWKDAVAEKGLDAARMHSGIIAQDVQDAFTAEGLDASDYAMLISGTWWETQTDVPAVEAVAEVVDEEGSVVTEAVEAKEAYTRTDTYHTLEEAPEGATERTRLGIRYPELLAFVAAYNDQRFLAIEARLAALEAA